MIAYLGLVSIFVLLSSYTCQLSRIRSLLISPLNPLLKTQFELPVTVFLSPIIKLVLPVTAPSDPITKLLMGVMSLLIEFKYD